MKAILIVIVMYAGEATTSLSTPMKTMEGCRAAAEQLKARERAGYGGWFVIAVCVEDR